MNRPENREVNYFSINPGPVDTKMHEEIANHGPIILSTMSKMAKKTGMLSDPNIIGKIIAKMSINGMKFNPESKAYDLPIKRGEIIEITQKNILFEAGNSAN